MTCSCCGVCSTLKGAAYWITSVQIFVGLSLFLKWAIIVFINGHHTDYFEDDRQQILYPLLLIYITVFIVLGSINFLAVQKESGCLLKWTSIFLLLVQGVQLCSHVFIGFYFPDEETEDPAIARIWHLQRFGIGLIGSIIYFTIVFLYSHSLLKDRLSQKERNFEIEDRYQDPPRKEDKPTKSKKNNRKNKGKGNESEGTAMHPSAPPPTPGPSQNDEDDNDEEREYIDADEYLERNVYVAGPDKRDLRL